ncbi:MAG: winged helix DNA-binding domain-containing protein [Aeromicrobium sp.]
MAIPATSASVLRARASHQRSGDPSFTSPEDVVAHFGCMQSQDFAMAGWAIGRRTNGLTDAMLGKSFTSGRFLRTHILRPTWHFVLPEDLGWMMKLTAPRVHRLMASHNKTIDLAEPELAKASEVIVETLSDGEAMTRTELAAHLAEAGIHATSIRLAHLFIHAELETLICNGPLAGKQHTYILAPPAVRNAAAAMTEDEALAQLARTYIRGHGPSQPADLSWWSSLTLSQSRKAFEFAGLTPLSIEGESYWTDETQIEAELPVAALIPAFDETISYVRKPLDHVRYPGVTPDLARGGGLLFVGGVIGGSWSRKVKAESVEIEVTCHGKLSKKERLAIELEADRYAAFLEAAYELKLVGQFL